MNQAPCTLLTSDKKNAALLVTEARTRYHRPSRPHPAHVSRRHKVERRPVSPRVSKSNPRFESCNRFSKSGAESAARQLFAEPASTSEPAPVQSPSYYAESSAESNTFHENALLTLKRLASGAFAGVVSRTAVAPLDVAKLKLMLSGRDAAGVASVGVVDVLKNTVKSEGVKGLFRGNALNCCRVAPGKAIELCAYETIKALTGRSDLAGGVAGALNTAATYPLEVLRTRVALDPAALNGGIVTSFKRIAKNEGRRTFYRGCAFSVAGVIPYTAAQYLAYDALCKGYRTMTKQGDVPPMLSAVFGSAAVIAASACTFPLEVYRRQLQLAGGTNAAAVAAMKLMVRQSGPAGLYRGLGASCLKLAPASGVYFGCFELAKVALHINQQQRSVTPCVPDKGDETEFSYPSDTAHEAVAVLV